MSIRPVREEKKAVGAQGCPLAIAQKHSQIHAHQEKGRIREQKAIGKKGYKQNSNISTYSLRSPDIIYHCTLVCLSSYKSKYFGLHLI